MASSDARSTVGYPGLQNMTGLSIRALRRLVSAHRIPCIRYSERVVRFSVEEIEAWMAAKVQPVKEAA